MNATSENVQYDKQISLDIARTVLGQLGGNKFKMMTGAKDFFALDAGLQFKIPQAKNRINKIKIQLNCMDLYDVTFIAWKLDRKSYDVKISYEKTYNDIYADQLQDIFTTETGLYTAL